MNGWMGEYNVWYCMAGELNGGGGIIGHFWKGRDAPAWARQVPAWWIWPRRASPRLGPDYYPLCIMTSPALAITHPVTRGAAPPVLFAAPVLLCPAYFSLAHPPPSPPVIPPWPRTAACVAKLSTFPVIPRCAKCTESVPWLTRCTASHFPHMNTSSHSTQTPDHSPADSMAAQLAPTLPSVAALRQDGAPTLRRKQSSPMMPPFMVSAPGKVIVYGEHAVVHGKVQLRRPRSSRRPR